MTYDAFLDHLFSRGRFGIKPGLERIKALLANLGNPHEKLTAVHVVGTNGKGSTAAFLSSILSCAGHRTGLFTSPHLISFTERMRVDGVEIREEDVLRIGLRVLEAAPSGTTFFEIVTAMAIVYFNEQGVEVAVLEAGMGGQSDATACVSGILTVITPISIDHSEYLGDTISAIAAEKAGIIAPGSRVVCAVQPEEALRVIDQTCHAKGAELFLAGRDFRGRKSVAGILYESGARRLHGLTSGLPGAYQAENALTAIAAAEELGQSGFAVSDAAIAAGIASASWPGRMETIAGSPRVLLDGAHNPAGATALATALQDVQARSVVGVIGVMNDKDLEGIIAPIAPFLSQLITAEPAVGRAISATDLAEKLRSLDVHAEPGGAVPEAVGAARRAATADGTVLVFGSLYLVGEVRAHLLGRTYRGIRG